MTSEGPAVPVRLGRLEMGSGGGVFLPFPSTCHRESMRPKLWPVLGAEQRKRFAEGGFVNLHVEKYPPLALVKSDGNLLPLMKGQGDRKKQRALKF